MNVELSVEINNYLKDFKLEEAINITENKLKLLPETDFHKMIGRNLFHLESNINEFIYEFYETANNFYRNSGTKGFLIKLFKSNFTKAICCELNEITLNYDLWYIHLFSYKRCGAVEDLDWLLSFDFFSGKSLTIWGFEDLQSAYKAYDVHQKWKDKILFEASEICELLFILRLQQVFQIVSQSNTICTNIPIFVTNRDYDIIYKTMKLKK